MAMDTSPTIRTIKKMLGMGPKDIELPHESKKKDPRLKKPQIDVKGIVEGYKKFREMGKSNGK